MVASAHAAIVTPPALIDGNGNVPAQVWTGSAWLLDSGVVRVDSIAAAVTLASDSYRVSGRVSVDTLPLTAVRGSVIIDTGYSSLRDVFGRQIEFDRTPAGSVVMVDKMHHEVHEGNAWTVNDMDSALSTNDTTAWLFQGGAIDAHVAINMNAALSGIVRLYQLAGAVADSGVALATINLNRHNGDTSTMRWYQESGINLTGSTTLDVAFLGGGTVANRIGGSTRSANEWVIPERGIYAIVFTSLNNTNYVVMNAEYYEHSDGQ